MAHLKTITRFSQAPAAPEEIPEGALVLIEHNNNVFKAPFSALQGEGTGGADLPEGVVAFAIAPIEALTVQEGASIPLPPVTAYKITDGGVVQIEAPSILFAAVPGDPGTINVDDGDSEIDGVEAGTAYIAVTLLDGTSEAPEAFTNLSVYAPVTVTEA